MQKRHPWRNAIVTLGFLLPIGAFVVWSSFQVSDFECEVCMAFEGRDVCRTVTGKTELEGLRTGIDNACALLASGVTDSLRCQRTTPRKAQCRPLGDA
ncbi:MAG: hypothetical protein ACRERC_17785 [Candidatus Binatia bacterium]